MSRDKARHMRFRCLLDSFMKAPTSVTGQSCRAVLPQQKEIQALLRALARFFLLGAGFLASSRGLQRAAAYVLK